MPACALGRRGQRLDLELGRQVDAEAVDRNFLEFLFARLHDARQRGVARFVEAQVRRDDGGQVERDRFEAAIDLADHGALRAGDLDLRGERRLRPSEHLGEHLADLIGVVVDRLLAEHHDIGLLVAGDLREHARDRESGSRRLVGLAPGSRGRRPSQGRCASCSCQVGWPIETSTTSPPPCFSLIRSASSIAISSNGLITHLTLSVAIPEPSGRTRIVVAGSGTRLMEPESSQRYHSDACAYSAIQRSESFRIDREWNR